MKRKLEVIHPQAAGIDIGAAHIYIDAGDDIVKRFDTFTDSLQDAVIYLKQEGVTTVAMEATGVYWVVLYDLIDKAGIDVWLVNGRNVKNVPGRKSDVSDCQWIRQLHSYGLLKKSFIPNESIRELRAYMRLREEHIRSSSRELNHLDKVLVLMNIRLSSVLSSLSSKSAINIIEAILQGQREPEILVELCDVRVLKNKRDQVLASLKGNYQAQSLFALRQAYDAWCFFERQITACDREVEQLLLKLNQGKTLNQENYSEKKQLKSHAPAIHSLHTQMLLLSNGRDLTLIPGITDYTVLQLFSEIGTDMKNWPTEKQFTSWLGLAPGKHTSGTIEKRVKGYKKTKAGNIFRIVSQVLITSKHNALGAFGRRIRSRKGPAIAIKALARKLATMFYRVMTKGMTYVEQGASAYEEMYKERLLKKLEKQVSQLKMQIVPLSN